MFYSIVLTKYINKNSHVTFEVVKKQLITGWSLVYMKHNIEDENISLPLGEWQNSFLFTERVLFVQGFLNNHVLFSFSFTSDVSNFLHILGYYILYAFLFFNIFDFLFLSVLYKCMLMSSHERHFYDSEKKLLVKLKRKRSIYFKRNKRVKFNQKFLLVFIMLNI